MVDKCSGRYSEAIRDVWDLLDNAKSNRVDDGYAPWHWDHELRDQLLELNETHGCNPIVLGE